jgi:hypothetical protein
MWLQVWKNFLRVSAVAQGAINRDFARLWGKDAQDLRYHDWPMRAGGRLPGGDDFSHGLLMSLRSVFLIFFLEAAGILAAVARATLVWRRSGGRAIGHDNSVIEKNGAHFFPRIAV